MTVQLTVQNNPNYKPNEAVKCDAYLMPIFYTYNIGDRLINGMAKLLVKRTSYPSEDISVCEGIIYFIYCRR